MESSTLVISDEDMVKGDVEVLLSSTNPTPVETLFLSNIDQTVVFPVETLFFFEPPSAVDTADIFDRVKSAVSEVLLNDYYFMAGRLRFETQTNRLELVCNNAGVAFVGATSRLRLMDLGDVSFPNPSFKHLILRTDVFSDLAQTPIFSLQVTRFACGGFSVGFRTSHSILDGRSAVEMFQNLASICRGEGMKTTHRLEIDRTCLRARDPPQIKYLHDEYIKLADLRSSSAFTTPDKPISPAALLQLSDTHVHKVFPFTPAMIKNLKEKTVLANCSTFEALVAHIWRARTKAVFTNDDTNPHQLSSVHFAVDIRSKISPPLSNRFIGNAVITARASATVPEMGEMPPSFCVEKVREAIGVVSTDEYVRSVVDWLGVHRGVPATAGGNFFVSAWWKLPFHELDFGYGKAVYGGPVINGMDEFVLLLADGKKGAEAGINVWMVLEEEKMERFACHVFDM